jgi:hypothetical protein
MIRATYRQILFAGGFCSNILIITETLLSKGVRWTRILRIEIRLDLDMKQPL